MDTSLKTILLVSKEHHPPAVQAAQTMAAWLKERGVASINVPSRLPSPHIREVGREVDAALILGGDGAVLGVGRALMGLHIPLLGVNFGRVGFLTEVPAQSWEDYLDDFIHGRLALCRYLALAWSLWSGEEKLASGWAVNDVVAARGEAMRAISLDIALDGRPFSQLRSDGIILSAPLGTTAYTASAGGPLLFPSLEAQVVTPICPFAGAFPPMVVPAHREVALTAVQGDVRLTIDGQETLSLLPGQHVRVKGIPNQMLLLSRDPHWYPARLIERGFVRSGPGNTTDNGENQS